MREIRTSGLMSGERKRSDAHRAQATAPLLDSTPTRSFGFWSELGIYFSNLHVDVARGARGKGVHYEGRVVLDWGGRVDDCNIVVVEGW